MNKKERVIYTSLILLGLYLTVRYALWWFQPQHLPINWFGNQKPVYNYINLSLFAALSFVVFFGMFLRIGTWFTIWFIKRPIFVPPPPDLKVAFLTCFVPGAEPVSLLRETLVAMIAADYPHDTWVLDEGDDPQVKELCEELGVHHFSRKNKDHYNQPEGPFRKKTKAGNLNSWRNENEDNYQFVAQIDVDHIPAPDYLTKQLGYFTDAKVGFIVTPQIYKNTVNWIAKGAAQQSHFYYGPLQQGLYGANMPILIGTTHIYRVEAMKNFGGYSPTISEDYLTSMHFSSHGWKGVYVPEILVRGLGPVTWNDYFNQQMRWSFGLFEILFKHTYKHIFKLSFKQSINLMFSQLYYFSGLATFIGFILTAIYLIFGINSTSMDFWQWAGYSLPTYFVGLFIVFFLHRYYIDPKSEAKLGLTGMIIGQAASIIYTISLFRFITGKSLTYKVTKKDETTKNSVSWHTLSFHSLLLLISIVALGASFVLKHDSFIIRFWDAINIIFLSMIIIVAYWESIAQKFGFGDKWVDVPPPTALNYSKYDYVIKHPIKTRLLYSLGIFSWVCTLYGFSLFLNLNPSLWLFFGPLLVIITFHNLLNYGINIFYKKFDVSAHERQKLAYWQSKSQKPPLVDIFLPVCGEEIKILKNTFESVQKIDYQNFKVYVLDDKGQSKVEALATGFGFNYLSRPNKGEMKKAGNLLYGFKFGKGEFYAVFDADFCPHPDFISDLLPYMQDEKVGIVQSPHYFEIGKLVHKRSPIEYGSANLQEQFFRTIQVARDRFGGAICAGSNTIYRRSALEKNGGPSQVDHGEDVNTGIDIINLGYKVKYVPVILAKGLSPDTLQAFYKQQNRWASSSMGLMLSGKIFKSKLTLAQRLCYLSGITYYISQIAYFLLPLQLLFVLTVHSKTISFSHSLPFIPYMFFSLVLLPLFSRKSKPKFGTYLAVMSSVYVHCFTIALRLRGKPAQWVPTNAITGKIESGFLQLNNISLIFISFYLVALSLLIFRGNLPLLNGVYLSLIFWIIWNIAMHFMYFFHTHAAILKQKATDAEYNPSRRNSFNFWVARTYLTLTLAIFSIGGSVAFYFIPSVHSSIIKTKDNLYAQYIPKAIVTPKVAAKSSSSRTKIEKVETTNARVTEKYLSYAQQVSNDDTPTTIYRNIIITYAKETNQEISSQQISLMEYYLLENLPLPKIKSGEVVEVSQEDLKAALDASIPKVKSANVPSNYYPDFQ